MPTVYKVKLIVDGADVPGDELEISAGRDSIGCQLALEQFAAMQRALLEEDDIKLRVRVLDSQPGESVHPHGFDAVPNRDGREVTGFTIVYRLRPGRG